MKAIVSGMRYATFKTVPGENGTRHRIRDGAEYIDFEITIDPAALIAAIGGRAVKSKSGRSRLQGRSVEVRVTKRAKVPE